MRVPSSGCQDSSEPPVIAASRSKINGHTKSTTYFDVRAMSWIMTDLSRPSTGLGPVAAVPSGFTIDQVRYGASRL